MITPAKATALVFALSGALLATPSAFSADTRDALSVAREIVQLSHRQPLTRDTYAKELRGSLTFCRGDQRCQADLDRTIISTATKIADKDAEGMARLFAQRLNQAQLSALLKFYRSPDGQAIVAVESDMSNELAQMGLESVREARLTISRNFCPSHPEICVNSIGRHPPSPPKS